MYSKYLKRLLDFFSAIIGFAILSPLFFSTTLVLFFVNAGKPFFIQKRPGKNGKIFDIIKFKTMQDYNPQKHRDVHDTKRVTKVGAFIRKYSLDEIPQLINVIIGDMSFVGPRPLLVSYLPLYNDFQAKRHLVRPGITGWAQINGRNTISWEQKFEYDVWYVENISFQIDLKILSKTVKKVFMKENITASEDITMEEFRGSES